MRDTIYIHLKDFDFVGMLLAIYQSEDEAKSVEVKSAILRLFVQLLRTFDNQTCQQRKIESILDLYLSNPDFKSVMT